MVLVVQLSGARNSEEAGCKCAALDRPSRQLLETQGRCADERVSWLSSPCMAAAAAAVRAGDMQGHLIGAAYRIVSS
ncbi:hypothetical protein TgHK011_005521 [Trichoderma gracile]|nr:hypothetical protein TgHK011_005521 [Trichoderma gracile]